MLDVLSITGVIFVLMAVGFGVVYTAIFSRQDMNALGQFVVTFALPALVFKAVSAQGITEIIDAGYVMAYLAGSLLMFTAGYIWASRQVGQSATYSTFVAMGVSCANSGFVGYPILIMALPAVATTALALNMTVEILVMIPLTLVMAERARGSASIGWRLLLTIVLRIAGNPIVIALFTGITVSVLAIELPVILTRPIELIAASSAALSLIVIGGSIATVPVRSVSRRLILMAMGKLLVHPWLTWLALLSVAAIGFPAGNTDLANAAILMAAMPPMSIYPILAQRYGAGDEHALVMLVMTVACFASISLVLWILQ